MPLPIYLDNSATTPVHPKVRAAMQPYLSDTWGNPSSIHRLGRRSHQAIENARQQVSRLLNCSPEEIYFTSGGTYSNNVALMGRARFADANGMGKHLITSSIEHPSVSGPAKFLETQGWRVTYLPVDGEGFIDPAALEASIRDDTSMISIMWANNEIGTIEPIAKLAAIASKRQIYFHTDAVQVCGKVPIDLSTIPISTLSLSGHKFYAPKGIGILFIARSVNLMPILFGGGQEHGLFPGTEGLANIVAVGSAAELASLDLDNSTKHLRQMQAVLLDGLLSWEGVKLTGPRDPNKRLPGHISVAIAGGDGEAMVMRSDLSGVCISSGSACHQGTMEPSHVLRAIGLSQQEAAGSARITAGHFNSLGECKQAVEILTNIFKNCGKDSPTATCS